MPIINPFGVVAGTLSAGTTKATLGEVVFSNSNNVSFGIDGQTITASVAGGGSGNTGSISAGTTRATLGEVVFSNSNGISFGVNGQTVTASYTVPSTAGLLSNINVSAGTTGNNLSNIVFSNSNNVSFGLNGSTVTASINTSLTNIRVSAGTTSNLLSEITFSNSNGISFGLNASTITASYTVPTVTNSSWTVSDNVTSDTVARLAFTNLNNVTLSLSTGAGGSHTVVGSINTSLTNIRVSAGTTSNLLSAITFSNANGVSFGIDASTITASHNGITLQTNQTLGLYAVGNTTGQSSSSTFDARTISFVGQGIVSVGYSNSSVNISAVQSVQTQGFSNTLGMSNLGNTSGTSGVISGTGLQYLFAGGPNITLSQSINGQSATLTISGGAGGAGNTGSISAGTTRLTLGEAVFSDSNGVSFGVNGQTVTASIATSLTAINVSAGTTSNNLSAITFSNSNNVSFGINNSTITASVNTSLTAINISAGTTSNNLSAVTFSNSNGISFGLNVSTITASYTVPTVTNSSWTVSDNATSGTVARLAFTNLNNVTLSLSTGAGGSHTIVGSVNTSLTNIRISAGTTSNLLSAVTFSNSNGISFGINASTITASYTVPGTLSVYAQSNTTQSSSGTIPFSSLQFQGAGVASVGVSNGSVVISVPAGGGAGMNLGISTLGNTSGTSGLVSNQMVFVGGNNITLSQSIDGQSATLTISGGGGGGGFSIPYFENFPRVSLSNVSNMTATLITQRPILIPFQLIGSLTHNFMDIEVSRATTGSNAFTMQAAIYTFVNSTQISRLASLQNVFSNTNTAGISGVRRIRLTGFEAAGTTLTPGQYVMMLYNSATATASMNYSYRGGITASPDVGVIGGGTNVVTTATSQMSNGGFRIFHGLWSTTTASPPESIALSDVSQHTRGLPIYFYMGRT